MPILITNIKAEVLPTYTTDVTYVTSVTGEAQFEDYINLNGFIAFLQNFTQVESLEKLQKPLTFGLKNQYNLPTTTLQISY